MEPVLQDLRLALRFLRSRPLFALTAIVSLAIGTGATTAVFSIGNALLLKTPPGLGEPERVVEVGRTRGGQGFDSFTYPDFLDYREQATPLEHLAAWRMAQLSFSAGGEAERVQGLLVSANYFDALGVRPARGRSFLPEEDVGPGTQAVVVVSHRFWRDRLGGDPGVIGRAIDLNRQSFTVVGVAPEAFRGHVAALPPDVYVPLLMAPALTHESPGIFENRNASWFHAVGRLAPGATLEQANAALATVAARNAQRFPETHEHRGARALALGPVPGGGRGPVTAFLAFILALSGVVLLVTCANVAGMLLARAAGREKEVAVRLALGAGRGRLVAQLVTEALTLFLIGGAAGLAIAYGATAALGRIPLPGGLPFDLRFTPDVRVLAFGLGVALLTGVLFGLAPALQATRPELVPALRDEGRSARSRAGRLRRTFVAAQVALSALLLVSSGLFLRALHWAAEADVGFDATGVEMMALDLSIDGYEEEAGAAFYARLLEEARAIPGAASAALALDLPLDLSAHEAPVYPEGWEEREPARLPAGFNTVSAGYFTTLRIPLLRGRDFGPSDVAGGPPVVVVSRELARRAWGDEDPIGKRLRWSGPSQPLLTVVGVVEDTPNQMVTDGRQAMAYLPLTQAYRPGLSLLVRSRLAGVSLAAPMRAAVRELDARLSLTPVEPVVRYTRLGTLPQRIAAGLSAALGGLALLLSGIGIYGVVAFAVAQRTREIGVRMALGARRAQVLRLILRGGLGMGVPGLIVGTVLAFALSRLIRGFLLGVPPGDPVTFGGVAVLLLAVVLLGSWVPARRAARVEPMRALRGE
ncbi:MAG TPA: ABC transporter permease [Longimicrobiales bacterium]|nr:ABC transporter permease [Longimicrobiales bacterium]